MTPAELAALVDRQPRIPDQDQFTRAELFVGLVYRKPKARKRA